MSTEYSTCQNTIVKAVPSLGFNSLLRFCLLYILILLLIVGVVGNVLTLVALPYVRRKYDAQFSVLKSTTFVLLLHLSLCDLLYISFGFTHFIHVLIVGGNPFVDYPYADNLCYTVALVRNLAAAADFTTMGAIALCVCRHKMCKECRLAGSPSYHGSHKDPIFGNIGIYLVIIFIWIWSFAVISCDVFGITGKYAWTNTMYGCDQVNDGYDHKNYGIPVTILAMLLIILVSYSLVIRRLVIDERKARTTMNMINRSNITKHIKMLFFISIAYAICVLPVCLMFDVFVCAQIEIKLFVSCLYWCMYGLNFVLYVTTSERMRAAYWIFLKDMFRSRKVEEDYETHVWWSGLRYMSRSEEERSGKGSCIKTDFTVRTMSHLNHSTYV